MRAAELAYAGINIAEFSHLHTLNHSKGADSKIQEKPVTEKALPSIEGTSPTVTELWHLAPCGGQAALLHSSQGG